MSGDDSKSVLEFLEFAGRLKHLKRSGWVHNKVKQPETVAGHMYRMAIMTFLLDGDDSIDSKRCMELSLVHDLAECIVGDLTPYCGVSPEEKHKQEDEAMHKLAGLAGKLPGERIYKLFKEYEDQETPEAHFVKDLDRFDMVLQAFEYEKAENRPGELQQFFDTTKGKFKSPTIIKLLEEVNSQRHSFVESTECGQRENNL